ncbi:serine hydrolase domain-containing protein [Maricaulis sp. CAU 1757]
MNKRFLTGLGVAIAAGLVWWAVVLGDARRFHSIPAGADAAEMAASLDAEMDRSMRDYGIAGAVAGVMHEGRWVWSARRGIRSAQGEPVTGATAFNLGSVSKPLASWAVLALAGEGRIDLDAPVSTYLTRWQFPDTPYDTNAITVRRLLEHAGGLNIHGYGGYEGYETPPADAVEQARTDYPVTPVAGAGISRLYSGGGYTLLQLMIEDVTGRSYADWLTDQVLLPLGMTASGADRANLPQPSTAFAFGGRPIETLRFLALAATGSWASGDDIERFIAAHADGGGVVEPGRLAQALAPSSVSDRHAMSYTREATDFGPLFGHGGNNSTWHAQIYVRPRTGDGFYFLTNTTTGAQLGLELTCAWRGWAHGLEASEICRGEAGLVRNLTVAAGLVGSAAIVLAARLGLAIASGRRMLSLIPRSIGTWRLVGRLLVAVLVALLFAACWVMFYTETIYWRDGVTFIDEIPLDEVRWLMPAVLAVLGVLFLGRWASPVARPEGRA